MLVQGFILGDEIFFETGSRIAALRGAMKQSEFAERLGVHRNSVVGWEAGKRLPDGESLVRMSEEFGADVSYILTGKTGGVAPQLPPDEDQLLAHYRQANSDGRERIRQISATAANAPKRADKEKLPKSGINQTINAPVVGNVSGGNVSISNKVKNNR